MYSIFRAQRVTILVLVLILGVLSFITYSFVAPQGLFSGLSNDLRVIEKDSGVIYTDLEGNPVSLIDFKGEPLIINAWASWIPFSQNELKLLEKVKQTQGDRITVLAINRMEDVHTVKAYLEYIGKPEGIVFLTDATDNFYKAILGYAMPETVFYSRDGVLMNHKRGVLCETGLNDSLQMIILKE